MGEGKTKGTVTSDREEIDEILRTAWDTIYRGNHHDLKRGAHDLIKKYGHLCHTSREQDIDDLTNEEVVEVCLASADTGPGLDGWHGSDLNYLPPKA